MHFLRAASFGSGRVAFALAIVLPLLSLPAIPAKGQVRAWRGVAGPKEIQAEFIDLSEGGVRVKLADGKPLVIPFGYLSTADQDYVLARAGDTRERSVDPKNIAVRERPAARKWALLVAVNDYQNFGDLTFCGRDMLQLWERLLALGFPPDQIILLHDGAATPELKPTRANIEMWLERMLSGRVEKAGDKNIRVQPRLVGLADQIVVAFSGHGVQLGGESYFCPGEADLANPKGTMLSMAGVYARLAHVTRGLRLLLVDACRNTPEGFDNAPAAGPAKGLAKAFEISGQQLPPGVLALSSCSAGQTSLEADRLGQGVFSYWLQAALGGAGCATNTQGDVEVRLNQVQTFVIDKTSAFAKNVLEREQTPHFVGSIEGNPLLGVLPAGKALREEQLHRTTPTGSLTQSYRLGLVDVEAPNLPRGWKGDDGVVTTHSKGRLAMTTSLAKPQTVTSPPLHITGDFALELEGWQDRDGQLELILLGDDGGDFSLHIWRSNYGNPHYSMTVGGGEPQVVPVTALRLGTKTTWRVERRGDTFTTVVNSERGSEFSRKLPDCKSFKGIVLKYPNSGTRVYDLRVDALGGPRATGATALYKPTLPKDRLPDGWKFGGQAENQCLRLVSPAGAIETRGDFRLQCQAVVKKEATLGLTLLGKDGGRSLYTVLHLPMYGPRHIDTQFPMTNQTFYTVQVNQETCAVDLQIVRKDGNLQLVINNQQVQQAVRDGGFGDFDGLVIDIWDGVMISRLEMGPYETTPAKPLKSAKP